MKVGFVQSFSIGGNGGGGKILRSLIAGQPFEWRSICTQPLAPQEVNLAGGREVWVPIRPVTRLDRTRLQGMADMLNPLFARRLRTRLLAILEEERFDVIHGVAHGIYDWQIAAEFCSRTKTPLIMSVHDDLRYILPPRTYRTLAPRFAQVWAQADHVFSISEELGDEYCRRFGKRKYEILTDGVESVAASPRPLRSGKLHVYFCGLLHFAYVENFLALGAALESLRGQYDVKLIVRGGLPFRPLRKYESLTEYRPFASDIRRDFDEVDVLYLPLPFGGKYDDFVRFSLSTKAITYLATGLPILYHGPPTSALYHLLNRHRAAGTVLTNNIDNVSAAIEEANSPSGRKTVESGLHLAEKQFALSKQRGRFWEAVQGVCGARLRQAVMSR